MGVPRLFPWITTNFPTAAKKVNGGDFVAYVDNLHIDAPSILHAMTQKVFNYGSGKRFVDPYAKLTYTEKRIKVYEFFFVEIVRISKMVIPKKILDISIDGPAPIAKQSQQRERRFVSAGKKMSGEEAFDSTQLTPGTLFMFELTKYLHFAIRKQIETDKSKNGWQSFRVIFSSPTVPGEGEHKALDYIRKSPAGESHCIFGPDGDLIMLTLAAHIDQIYILREDITTPDVFYLVDMSVVRNGLPEIFGVNGQDPSLFNLPPSDLGKYRSKDDASNDFIFIGFFVGNDFVPKIQMFKFLEDGLELMVATYAKMRATLDWGHDVDPSMTHNGSLNPSFFRDFIATLAANEQSYLEAQAADELWTASNPNPRWPPDPRFRNATLLKHYDRRTGKLDFSAYQVDYYEKAGLKTEAEIDKMCDAYLRTFVWAGEYYTKGLPSWTHYYPYHYPPLMTDLVFHLVDNRPFDRGTPSLPFIQLLSVLPPSSAGFLPEGVRELMTDPESPLVKAGIYDTNFEIDYEGKTKEHQGVALLKFADIPMVKKAYAARMSSRDNIYGRKRYARNQFSLPEFFFFDAEYKAKYISDYGVLDVMHVRKVALPD